MIKDANKARTMLMCSQETDEDTLNLMAFEMNERLKEIIRHSESEEVKNIAKSQMDVLAGIYTDGGSIQEKVVEYGVVRDARICNAVRQFIAYNRLDKLVAEEKLKLLSDCQNAESKYLAALLLMKTNSDYETCERALKFIEEAYKLEPFNPLYEDFYKGLFETFEGRKARIRQEALERKRLAEMELQRVEEQRRAMERREAERLRIEEESEKPLKVVVLVVFVMVIVLFIIMLNTRG